MPYIAEIKYRMLFGNLGSYIVCGLPEIFQKKLRATLAVFAGGGSQNRGWM